MADSQDTWFALDRRADLLMEVGRNGEALPLLDQALRLSPDNARLMCRTSLAHFNLKDYQRALEFANRAIEADPNEEWGHRLRSVVFMRLAKYKSSSTIAHQHEALNSALEAVRLGPREPLALSNLCGAQLAAGRTAEARQTAELMLSIAPDNPGSHEAMALVRINEKNWFEAAHHCRMALAIDPASNAAMNNLGLTLLRSGQTDEAVKHFFESARLDPSNELIKGNLNDAIRQHLKLKGLRPRILLLGVANPLGAGILVFAIFGILVVNAVSIISKLARMDAPLRGYVLTHLWSRFREWLHPGFWAPAGAAQLAPDERRQYRRNMLVDLFRGISRIVAIIGGAWLLLTLVQLLGRRNLSLAPSSPFGWSFAPISLWCIVREVVLKVRTRTMGVPEDDRITRLKLD